MDIENQTVEPAPDHTPERVREVPITLPIGYYNEVNALNEQMAAKVRTMVEFIVKTEQGRNISYMGASKAEAETFAFNRGHCVKQVFTLDEFERERELILLDWRFMHNKEIEEAAG